MFISHVCFMSFMRLFDPSSKSWGTLGHIFPPLEKSIPPRTPAFPPHLEAHPGAQCLRLRVWPYRETCPYTYMSWLVVYLPLWKIWKSIGMMTFPIYVKMFQTTNQWVCVCVWLRDCVCVCISILHTLPCYTMLYITTLMLHPFHFICSHRKNTCSTKTPRILT